MIDSTDLAAFGENAWIGSALIFGEGRDAAAIAVTHRDERCAMVNFDPDTAHSAPEILKTIARQRDNKAGVYASVIRPGRLVVGQAVFLA